MITIGKRHLLTVVRETDSGLYLDGGEQGEILLPGRYVPRERDIPEKMDVFVYRDSEGRLVATTEQPLGTVGEVVALNVVSVSSKIGAFLDWGLDKDLLLPFREQTGPVRVGQRVVVCICLDSKTDRIMASARINRHVSTEGSSYREGQPVEFMITGRTPLGYTAIVENEHPGLLYHDDLLAPMEKGQKLRGFVRKIRAGGKIDLSLDASGYKRVGGLAIKIIDALQRNEGRLAFDDNSSPEDIRAKFAVSKKAFKQALGKLYRMRRIEFTDPGIRLRDNSNWSPND